MQGLAKVRLSLHKSDIGSVILCVDPPMHEGLEDRVWAGYTAMVKSVAC